MKSMKKYTSFFRLRIVNGLQYRAAALGGITTQFAWGFMEIMVYSAFYQSSTPEQFPMEMQALASYIWLQQAFLVLFSVWSVDWEILDLITTGNLAYELCRPLNLYVLWFAKDWSGRLSRAALRFLPILVVAMLLPAPYGLVLPEDPLAFCLFLVSGLFGSILVSVCGMFVYIFTFFTMSSVGVRTVFNAITEICSGAVVPLPFFPSGWQTVIALLPFASMQNVPFRIYGGDISGQEALVAIGLQVFWLVVLLALGTWLMRRATARAVVQGG